MDILWVNPVHTSAYDADMAAGLQAVASADTSVDVVSFQPPGPTHLEYAAHGMTVAAPLISAVRWARERSYDAVCIGCFYDPGLRAAREVAGRMIVTAPAESCLHTAAALGSRCAVLVANRTCLADARHAVEQTGLGGRVASYRDLQMRVEDFQEDVDRTRDRLLSEARSALVDDGADVLVMGCTLEFGFGAALQEELGAPVLDATTTPLLFAEYLVGLADRFGWYPSALDYQPPPAHEMAWLPPAEQPGPLTRGRVKARPAGKQQNRAAGARA